ncbi:MAG: YjbQ family protein [Bacteroidales bacterium]|nr:YjbQ family protein [Bacteroidales bacterium]
MRVFKDGLYDITRQVEAIVSESGVQTGLVNVYVQGATAGIMILFCMIDPLFTNLKVY